MIRVSLNEQSMELKEGTSLFEVRKAEQPQADIVILNGAAMAEDVQLQDGDEICLIQRGVLPTEEELESLMVARHTPGVHAKVKAATVGIAGLGGLGSAIAIALARVGIGKLLLADFDVVEPSNLNRQQYFVDQLGMLKTEALEANLRRINPYVTLECHPVRLTPGNVSSIFEQVDVMIEAFDRVDQKVMIMQHYLSKHPDVPFIGASGLAGYGTEDSIKITKMGNNTFVVGDLETSARPGCGLMAPRVGIAAATQANLALRLIVDGKV